MLTLSNFSGAMHDNDTIHGIRVPSIHPPDIPHPAIIKRPFEPIAKSVDNFDENYNQEIDDDFSDHDSHYSEDFIDDPGDYHGNNKEPNITQRLLNFAEMVNADIQRFFGKKKDEDSCDIYEDKWKTTKSGRELYYADLLRIAQGENVDSTHTKELLAQNNFTADLVDNKHKFSGRLDTKMGLGPLAELFEYGLRDFLQEKKAKSKKSKKMKFEGRKHNDVTPMNQRKFPDSFWREPGATKSGDQRVNGTGNLLQSSRPLDFSDLLHSWTRGEEDEFSGDMSSSDMSVASSESPMQQM
ncbi:hypothetical protein FSP39_024386 [Pinctada imbricata]|uniref:Uncharacterized protein n=1 Tax=Pinctada imbricata TaxID=66713 RepID=A0AA88XUN6_PINIB|nr:hypothetical protein FSP39_024386 [Pinctada imbricata]